MPIKEDFKCPHKKEDCSFYKPKEIFTCNMDRENMGTCVKEANEKGDDK